MTPIICAKTLPPKKRSPSSLTTRHARSNIHSTSISMPSAISWNAASQNSSSSVASLPASKKPPEITKPSSLSLLSSYGCDKCPHRLERPTLVLHGRLRPWSAGPRLLRQHPQEGDVVHHPQHLGPDGVALAGAQVRHPRQCIINVVLDRLRRALQ